MKLASFDFERRRGFGVVHENAIFDASGIVPHVNTLREALGHDLLAELCERAIDRGERRLLSEVKLELPVRDPGKIICIGRNYRSHIAETGGGVPEHPEIFLRTADSLEPHGGTILCSRVTSSFDYEGELAVVIGKRGHRIAREDALAHVAGYTIFNDGSMRDYQRKHSLAAGKNFHRSGGMGPWLVTSDEIADPSRLNLTTRLNGVQVQNASLDMLVFDVPHLISYLSEIFVLEPGDVIATGTPDGVGALRTPPLWIACGDRLEIEISRIGSLALRAGNEEQ